ncbi:hypothetical protein K461DRAFT_292916 [Myriangium duriaei CBS 260.36]|uniref:Uncharacterized protein n=1 Tax=Myriangium duriaei CBS 260.36 TaxID=1168546 RepID=A0A9P4J2G6_9PEZI|nr:hypothetical protein K461DRAFT_292916 [Myriangium duriaei CBS 260.36]
MADDCSPPVLTLICVSTIGIKILMMISSTSLHGHAYNRLPDVSQLKSPGDEHLEALWDLFVEYGVHRTYGLILVHKHAEIQPNQVMVHHGMSCSPVLNSDLGTRAISGRSFCLHYGVFQAYEYDSHTTVINLPNDPFLEAFRQYLVEERLDLTLGLTKIDPNLPPLMESCADGKVINSEPVSLEGAAAAQPIEWKFGEVDDCLPIVVVTNYHWALMRGPYKEIPGSTYTRFHAKNEPSSSDSVWIYEHHTVENVLERALLVRVCVAKINRPGRMEDLLAQVPVYPDNQPNWNCVAWVKTALEALDKESGICGILGPRRVDWETVRTEALDYVRMKKAAHRFDGKGDFDQSKAATYDLLTGKELIP